MAVTAEERSRAGFGEPATKGFAITPDNNAEIEAITRGVWVGGAGALKVTLQGGDIVTLSGITAGTLLPIRARKVFSTDTTATLIVGLY